MEDVLVPIRDYILGIRISEIQSFASTEFPKLIIHTIIMIIVLEWLLRRWNIILIVFLVSTGCYSFYRALSLRASSFSLLLANVVTMMIVFMMPTIIRYPIVGFFSVYSLRLLSSP
eukprot:TRINITY_DN7712_c0_g1_i1.p1 TRINITY_DN7712_c0_g1~~TRINITY_DN7712_c0_g1_i1.p1  ORF type:complete len:116 (-),score=5.78 TRINITY_DN7712_c0_g1_i1:39-386(-)